MPTVIFTPPANGDGYCYDNSSATWATVRGAAASVAVSLTTNDARTDHYPALFGITRSFLPFLTGTTIPENATIVSATLSLYVISIDNTNWSATANSICLTDSTQADPTSLVVADYNNITLNSPTEFITRVLATDLAVGEYNNFALNANGLANIQKGVGNYSKFCLRASGDVDDVAPGAATCYQGGSFYSSDTAGKEPKLTVEWIADEIARYCRH